MKDNKLAPIIRSSNEKGNSQWIHASSRLVPSKLLTLALMPRLGIAHEKLPENLQCPGCRITLSAASAMSHVSGCVKCPGNNTTMKHNALVRRIYNLCLKAGIPCEREPRQFTSYKCSSCGDIMDCGRKREHQQICKDDVMHRSGPDLAIYWASGEVYYDLTVVHELALSNLGKRGSALMKEALLRKRQTYVNTGLITSDKFQCLPILSGGSMHENLKILLKSLADAGGVSRETTLQDFTLHLQELNGTVTFSQLRKYLADQHTMEYGF